MTREELAAWGQQSQENYEMFYPDAVQPTTTQNKLDTLNKTKQEKLKRLSPGYRSDTVLGLNDADSIETATLGNTRSSAPSGTRYDAVELKHGSHPYDMYGKSKEERDSGAIGKSEYSMQRQREQVAAIKGKPLESVTEQDMIDVGNMQQIQKLADLARGKDESRWEAPLIENVVQTNLTGHGYVDEYGNPVDGTGDVPLNIPTEVNPTGQVFNGRPAVSFKSEAGVNVTEEASQNPRLNAFGAITPKEFVAVDTDNRLAEAVDLAQSQGLKLWSDMAKGARKATRSVISAFGGNPDELGFKENTRLLGTDELVDTIRNNEKVRDEIVGYGSRDLWNAEQNKFAKAVEGEKYGQAAWNVVTNLDRYLAQSAPEMALLMTPYVGMPTLVGTRLSNQMEAFEKSNGRPMTAAEAVETAVTITATLVPEKLLVKTGATKVLDTLTKGTNKKKAIVDTLLSAAGEGGQEAAEAIQEQWATGKAEDRYNAEALKKYATSDNTIGGTIAGAIMGGALRGGGETAAATIKNAPELGTIKDKVESTLDTVAGKFNKPTAVELQADDIAQAETTQQNQQVDEILKQADESDAKGDYMGMDKAVVAAVTAINNMPEGEAKTEASKQMYTRYKKLQDTIKAQAAEVVDNGNVAPIKALGSDERSVNSIMRNIFGAREDLDSEAIDKAMDTVAREFGVSKESLAKLRDAVKEEKQLFSEIEKGFPSKSQTEVESEVVSGPRGYKFYYDTLKNAEAINDTNTVEAMTNKLNSFKNSQASKLEKLSDATRQVTEAMEGRISRQMEATGSTREEAINQLLKAKNEITNVEYGINEKGEPLAYGVNSKNVLQKMQNPEYSQSVFGLMGAIGNSIKAMDMLVPSVRGEAIAEPEVEVRAEEVTAEPETVEETIEEDKPSKTYEKARAKVDVGIAEITDHEGYVAVKKQLNALTKHKNADVVKAAKEGLEVLDRVRGEFKNKPKVEEKPETEKEVETTSEPVVSEKPTTARVVEDANLTENTEEMTSTGKGIDTTKLSEETSKQVEKQTAFIKRVLDQIIDSGMRAEYTEESPFRLLMKDGKYPEEVATAMAISVNRYIAENLSSLRSNEDYDIAKMLGLKTSTKITPEVRRKFKSIGNIENNEAATLGRYITKTLGVKADGNTDFDLQERLESDAGATALAVMEKMGLVERVGKINIAQMDYYTKQLKGTLKADEKLPELSKRDTVHTIKLKKKQGWLDSVKKAEALADKINEETDTVVEGKKPRTEKKAKTKHKTRNAEDWTKLTKEQERVLFKAENRAHEIDMKSMNLLKDMWGGIVEQTEKVTPDSMGRESTKLVYELSEQQTQVAKLLGWTDPKDTHVDRRENVEAKNREIIRSVQNLIEFTDEVGPEDVYFDYFFSKNGRFFIDSAKINPQTDKLHRFIVNVNETSKAKTVNTDQGREAFKIAVVQAFDGSKVITWKEKSTASEEIVDGEVIRDLGAVDKQSQEDNIKQFEQIASNEVIKKAIENPTAENVIEAIDGVDHPSHAMMAILELGKYNEESFTTNMTMETDAVTSGFILGMLTNPVMEIGKLKEWLAKGGVWFNESYGSYGEWRQSNKDSYETGAEVTNHKLGKAIKDKNADWLRGIIGNVDRKFMKNPFMVFIYGAGTGSIKSSINNGITEKILDGLSNEKTVVNTAKALKEGVNNNISELEKKINAKDTKNRKGLMFALKNNKKALEVLSRVSEKSAKEAAKSFRNTSATSKNTIGITLDTISRVVSNTSNNTYGKAASEALETEFAEIVEMRKSVNSAFVGMFGSFKAEYDARVKEAQGDRKKPTKYMIDEVLRDMVDEGKVPGIMTVEANNASEKAPIMNKARVKAGDGSSVQIKTKPRRTVHPLVYEMVASGTAGAVVNIHYLDGALIMKIIDDSKGLGVHDAYVTHVNNIVGTARNYNENVWKLTQQFNMVERVQEELNKAISNSSEDLVKDAIWDNYVATFGKPNPLKEGAATRDSMFDEMMETLSGSIKTINENKKLMNEGYVTIGHMAGPDGSTWSSKAEVAVKPKPKVESEAEPVVEKNVNTKTEEKAEAEAQPTAKEDTTPITEPKPKPLDPIKVKVEATKPVESINRVVEQQSKESTEMQRIRDKVSKEGLKTAKNLIKYIDSFGKMTEPKKRMLQELKDEVNGVARYGKDGKYKYLKNVHPQREAVKDTAHSNAKVGGSEAEQDTAREEVFKSKKRPEEEYSEEDIAELERMHQEELEYQAQVKAESAILAEAEQELDNKVCK